jgi:hypothetical protein
MPILRVCLSALERMHVEVYSQQAATNTHTEVGGISLAELNTMEREFLALCNYALLVRDPECVQRYVRVMDGHPWRAHRDAPSGVKRCGDQCPRGSARPQHTYLCTISPCPWSREHIHPRVGCLLGQGVPKERAGERPYPESPESDHGELLCDSAVSLAASTSMVTTCFCPPAPGVRVRLQRPPSTLAHGVAPEECPLISHMHMPVHHGREAQYQVVSQHPEGQVHAMTSGMGHTCMSLHGSDDLSGIKSGAPSAMQAGADQLYACSACTIRHDRLPCSCTN